jgi:hypothetical protein
VNETAVLQQLAAIYVVPFDTRAVDTYETLAARAASYGLLDVEVNALIDMAYPLSWIDGERALAVVDRALRLGARQTDPLRQARTRASCLVRRIWTGGWSPRDADDCRQAIEQIRRSGDALLIAAHLIDFNFIRWASSEYRAAHRRQRKSHGPRRRAGGQPVSELRALVEPVHPALEPSVARRVG